MSSGIGDPTLILSRCTQTCPCARTMGHLRHWDHLVSVVLIVVFVSFSSLARPRLRVLGRPSRAFGESLLPPLSSHASLNAVEPPVPSHPMAVRSLDAKSDALKLFRHLRFPRVSGIPARLSWRLPARGDGECSLHVCISPLILQRPLSVPLFFSSALQRVI